MLVHEGDQAHQMLHSYLETTINNDTERHKSNVLDQSLFFFCNQL